MTEESKQEEVRFKHIRVYNGDTIASKGGVTFAYAVIKDEGRASVVFNYAKCHHSDVFCRLKGRELSFGRFIKNASDQVQRSTRSKLKEGKWHRYNYVVDIGGELTGRSILTAIHSWFYEAVRGDHYFTTNGGRVEYFTEGQIAEYVEIRNMLKKHLKATER